MDHEPLVTEQIEAGARFLRQFEKYAPVTVAFWLVESGRRYWHLYVASDKFAGENLYDGYDLVVRITGELQDPWLGPLPRVTMIDPNDPRAQEALARQRRYPGRTLPRVYDTYFGNVMADEVYLYPMPLPTPSL